MDVKSEEMTLEQFIVAATSYAINSMPESRMGQSYMTSLQYHRPDLFDKVMDVSADELWRINPYYNDDNIPMFFAFIAANWSGKED